MGLANGVEATVIVGAGPAGVACAWRLAQLGYAPLLVERATFPRDKVCGDALSGKVIALLRKLGGVSVLEDLRRQPFVHPVQHLDFISGKGHRVRLSFPPKEGYPQGFVAPRRDFDAWLIRQLPPSVRLWTGFTVQRIERAPTHWVLYSSAGEPLRAAFLVGADGTTSRVAPLVWAFHRLPRPVIYPAVRGYLLDEPLSGLELHFRKPYLPGYLWRFPLTGSWLNVGIGLPPQTLRQTGLSLRKHLQALFPSGENIHGHGIPVSLEWRPLTAPGVALVGDAAALADPFTGEGIGNALLSGIRLAEALIGVAPDEWHRADLSDTYTRPLYRALRQEMRLTRALHQVARSAWKVESILGLLERFPSWTSPLLRWYGAQ